MLTNYPETDTMETEKIPWPKYLGKNIWDKGMEETDEEPETENAQPSYKDMKIYQLCPLYQELILVKCQFCNFLILPSSFLKHFEQRHAGPVKYERDPEFSIFRKVRSPPTATVAATANSRASSFSTPPGNTEGPCSSRTSVDASVSDQSPRIAEQFLGWPNSPHGAMLNAVQKSKSKAVIPANSKSNSSRNKSSSKNAKQKKVVPPPEILPALLSSTLDKDEPYNQTFSFSAANNSSLFNKPSLVPVDIPSMSSFDMPSTSTAFDLSATSSLDLPSTSYKKTSTSQDSPSTSYRKPSTSQDLPPTSYKKPSTSRHTLPCEPISAHRAAFEKNFPPFQLPDVIASEPPKEPVIEKLVLRRVLQTDTKEPAEGSQSVQGSKGKKDPSQQYFMVVKSKDRQPQPKATDVVQQDKSKVKQEKKLPESHRPSKQMEKLIQDLKDVKKELDRCNQSKKEIERKLALVKADLEKTKRQTHFQNEALLKQNEKFEREIEVLKRRNEELSNCLENAQMYNGFGNHAWNFADNMSKQFQNIEEQKIELQRRIEELESESREIKNSSTIERNRYDAKFKQYLKIMQELKRRLDEQREKSDRLLITKANYEKNIPSEICFQVKSQLAALQQQSEVYEVFHPGMITPPHPTPPITPGLSDNLLPEVHNYLTFQSQMSPDSSDVFQQPLPPDDIMDEEGEVS